MKLSIIVPVYNVEAYLQECVDSLLAQTIGDLEIFLIDDGSTDRSGEIADRYAAEHPGVIFSRHLDNGGQGRARNIALPLAKGDYLGFVDSDDWILPDMYEKLYRRCEETGADIAVCNWLEVFPDGRTNVLPARYQTKLLSAAGSACNKIFRRELLGSTRFPEGMWYEDFYFSAMLMIRANRIEYLDEPLYCYRQSAQSTMRNNNAKMNLDLLHVLDLLGEEMLSRGMKDDYESLILNHVLLDSINRVCQQNSPDRAKTLAELRAYVRKKIPDLDKCQSYREETRNRRIIMKLNYWGLHELGQMILRMSSRV